MKRWVLCSFTAVALAAVMLYACRDTSDITEPSAATAAVSFRLTITGLGTGTGKVTSSPAGINCTITSGVAGTTGCSALFTQGRKVTLTATTPVANHSFVGWGSPCSGTGTCTVTMNVNRSISARFLKGPFTIKISAGNPGGGSGKVTSQAGLIPRIDCTITNGTLSGSCSRSYPANTLLTLTATPASGYVFDGWREPGCGTGSCQIKVIQPKTVAAPFILEVPSTPATEGLWDPPKPTPVVAVHVHLLPTSKVLLWGDNGTAYLWPGFTSVTKPHRIYCSGHTFLSDGRLLVVGGATSNTTGLKVATLFNQSTNAWVPTSSMAQGRYYPTLTTLPNGDILAVSGHDAPGAVVIIPEVWNGTSWRQLTTARLSIPAPYYPAVFVAPNGKPFLAGFPQTTRYLDVTGTGQWTTVGNRRVADRVMGSAVMYAPGKILYAGGGNGQPQNYNAAPTASAEVIDLNDPAPSWRAVESMAFARRQMNATILADGSVLVTGGTSAPGFNVQGGAVHEAEIWNPETGTWKIVASEVKNRTYHGTALLLPSGRVFSSGSGEGGDVPLASSEFSFQLFSPPYLFNSDGSPAPRPSITSAPAILSYGQTFTVETPNAASVAKVHLIRLGSVTHAFNASQQLVPLKFEVTGATLSATAPPDGKMAPPGYYMLFLVNGSDVPSTAKIVRVGL